MFHEIIIASPLSAFISLGQMTMTVDFCMNVGVTIKRFGLGLLFGSLAGFFTGTGRRLEDQCEMAAGAFPLVADDHASGYPGG